MSKRLADIDRVIAVNVKEMRQKAGITQAQVAAYLKVVYQSYQKMEGGKTSFRASTLHQLAHLYGTNICDMFTGSELVYCPTTVRVLLEMSAMKLEQKGKVFVCAVNARNGK